VCGIVGVVQGSGLAVSQREIASALAAIRHRGPDDEGAWSEGAITLGHRRLSIVDLSPAGHQPMLSGSTRYVISFNGEIYNHRALRADLDARARRPWRGASDTEVLLELIAEDGIEAALAKVDGMFAFALWDRLEKRLFLARDRFGEKPLFYMAHRGGFAFASELGALEQIKALDLSISTTSTAQYFLRGYIPAPLSIYERVHKLPPGGLLAWREGETPQVSQYWTAESLLQNPPENVPHDMASAVEQLDRLIQEAVAERMVADVPVGVFLSGGVDSSLIAAAMQRCASQPVTTLTLGFEDPRFNEADHARAIAAHLGSNHIEEVATANQALAVVAKLGRMYDEPLADSSQIPTYLVCAMARRHVTVALSGDGGDEVFAGYRRHFATPRLWHRLRALPMRGVAEAMINVAPLALLDNSFGFLKGFSDRFGAGASVGRTMKRIAPWLRAHSLLDLHEYSLEKWPRNASVVAGARGAWEQDAYVPPREVDQLCLHDMRHYLPGDILNKVDRASMAVSLETRIPYLDPAIAHFALNLPPELRLSGATGKLVLRETLKRYVPEHLFDRQKTGFAPPLEAWLIGPLREWAEDLMSPAELGRHGLLDVPRVRKFWDQYVQGGTLQDARVWSVLQFQSWMAARTAASAPPVVERERVAMALARQSL